jgi:hypothetical protein
MKAGALVEIKYNGNKYSGFLIFRTKNLTLVNAVTDFVPQGFLLFIGLNKKSIKKLDSNIAYLKGIKLNGLNRKLPKFRITKKTLSHILQNLSKDTSIVLIENRHDNSFLGAIDSVSSQKIVCRYLTTNLNFLNSEEIKLQKIQLVEWDNTYLRTLEKLIR